MTTEKYNGWKNRSTWLAKLHIDNDGLEIYEKAQAIYKESLEGEKTSLWFARKIKELLLDTQVEKEEGYNVNDVDFQEIHNSMELSS